MADTVRERDGVEAWCHDCGSIAWYEYPDEFDDGDAFEKADRAASLHGAGHARIGEDTNGWPCLAAEEDG